MAKKHKKVKIVLMGKKGHGRTYSKNSKIPKNFGKNKDYVTLDELEDETFGKKGTPKRDKFDKKMELDIRKDIIKDLIPKMKDKINSTPLNNVADLLIQWGFKDMVLFPPELDIIKESDLKGYSLEEMITVTYGKKGTKKRNEAEKRINGISKDLVKNNKLKEKAEKSMSARKKSFSKNMGEFNNKNKNWDKK